MQVTYVAVVCRKVLKMLEWTWYPALCSLEAFDAGRLSQRLANRYVLFVGDSLMVQQFVALNAIMHQAVSVDADPNPVWEHFYTKHAGVFQLEGIQFLVGDPMDAVVNQSLEVLPNATWTKMLEKAGAFCSIALQTGRPYHQLTCGACRYRCLECWRTPLASPRQ